MQRPTLLLAGFEPFGSWKRNVTGEAVAALDGVARDGLVVRAAVLPVAWPRAGSVLAAALERAQPAAVVAFGIHGKKRGAFRVETLAANELRFRIPDNDGRRYRGRPVVARGPRALESSLPPSQLVRALRASGLRARFSRDAGRFLCNAVYYSLLARGLAAAFVHVPPREEQDDATDVFAAIEAVIPVAARAIHAPRASVARQVPSLW